MAPPPEPIVRVDTVTVTVADVRRDVLQPADSAIAACLLTWGTCEAERANLSERLRLTAQQREEWKLRASPSLFRQFTDRLPWLGAGVLLGAVVR